MGGWAPIDWINKIKQNVPATTPSKGGTGGWNFATPTNIKKRAGAPTAPKKAESFFDWYNKLGPAERASFDSTFGKGKTASPVGSSRGGSSTVSNPALVDPIAGNTAVNEPAAPAEKPYVPPFQEIYGKAVDVLRKGGDASLANFDAAKQSTTSQYTKADKQLFDMYRDSQDEADASASGLGVNPVDVYKGNDANLRKLQENRDSTEAAQLGWYDQMKTLTAANNESRYAGLSAAGLSAEQEYMSALRDQAAAQQAEVAKRQQELDDWIFKANYTEALKNSGGSGGGGGGGGGGSGGGSSSGKVTEKATKTEQILNPYASAAYAQLAADDPQAAAQFMNIVQLAAGDPQNSVKGAQEAYNAAANYVVPKVGNARFAPIVALNTLGRKAQPAIRKKKTNTAAKVLAATQPGSGLWNNATGPTTITSSSTNKFAG